MGCLPKQTEDRLVQRERREAHIRHRQVRQTRNDLSQRTLNIDDPSRRLPRDESRARQAWHVAVDRRREQHGHPSRRGGAQLAERAHGDQLSAAHEPDPLADAIDFRQDVRREEHGRPPGARELVHRLCERFDHQRIEAGGGLIEDEQRRLGHQRLNDAELALHPVRVVAHAPLQIEIADVEAAEQKLQPSRGRARIAQRGQEPQIARAGQLGIERHLSRQIADAAPRLEALSLTVEAEN